MKMVRVRYAGELLPLLILVLRVGCDQVWVWVHAGQTSNHTLFEGFRAQFHGHPDWVSGHVDLWRCVDSPMVSGHVDLWRCVDSPMVTLTGSVDMWTFGDVWTVPWSP